MALTPEQNAALQLILERGRSYTDLAILLDADKAEIRTRARAALTELGRADPDRNVALTDYLLGQADPIGRADVVRHLRDHPEDHALADRLCEILREEYPSADLPRLPGTPRPPRRPRRSAPPEAGGTPLRLPWRRGETRELSLSERQVRTMAGLGGGSLVLLLVILGIAGVFGGGDDPSSTAAGTVGTTTGDSETTAADAAGEELARIPLAAPGGGDATGEANVGLATADQAYVDFSVEKLDPAPQGKTYVVMLLLNERRGYPLSPFAVSQQGTFSDRFAIESVVLPLIARTRFVDVSLADNDELQTAILEAQRRTSRQDAELDDLLLDIPGETVLRGAVPRSQPADPGAGAGAGDGG